MMHKKEYVTNEGNQCPRCGSENIGKGPIEADAGNAVQSSWCTDCQCQWNDIYELTSYEVA